MKRHYGKGEREREGEREKEENKLRRESNKIPFRNHSFVTS